MLLYVKRFLMKYVTSLFDCSLVSWCDWRCDGNDWYSVISRCSGAQNIDNFWNVWCQVRLFAITKSMMAGPSSAISSHVENPSQSSSWCGTSYLGSLNISADLWVSLLIVFCCGISCRATVDKPKFRDKPHFS